MTQTATVLAPLSIDHAIDRYLISTTGRLDRVVAELVLAEPTTCEIDLAGRTLDRLVETVAGLAIGSLVGAVLAGIRRGFGAEVRARVERAVARTIGRSRRRRSSCTDSMTPRCDRSRSRSSSACAAGSRSPRATRGCS